jgi:hypothetical protein
VARQDRGDGGGAGAEGDAAGVRDRGLRARFALTAFEALGRLRERK